MSGAGNEKPLMVMVYGTLAAVGFTVITTAALALFSGPNEPLMVGRPGAVIE